MSFFSPTEAPHVYVEPLPATTQAVLVECKPVSNQKSTRDCLVITAWVPGKPMRTVGTDHDVWVENNCHDCDYYTEDMEIDATDVEIYSSRLGADLSLIHI